MKIKVREIIKFFFRPIDSFRNRKRTINLEAEVNRYETILKTLEDLKVSEQETNLESSEDLKSLPEISSLSESEQTNEPETKSEPKQTIAAVPEKPVPKQADILLDGLKKETLLSQYLTETDNDPVLALAYAKGEIAYQNKLRSSFLLRSLLDKAMLPILLIIITAFAGNYVGDFLQKQSFERNKAFDVKLERLREGEKSASDLLVSFYKIAPFIERDEARKELDWDTKLNNYIQDLNRIRTLSFGVDPEKKIDGKLQGTSAVLNSFIECLGNKSGEPKKCSETYSDKLSESFINLQDSISETLIKFLESKKY